MANKKSPGNYWILYSSWTIVIPSILSVIGYSTGFFGADNIFAY
jgi:hypothetical protein